MKARGGHLIEAQQKEAGFSLLEVLAALVLLGFLLIAIYTGLRTTSYAIHRGQALLQRLDAVDAAQQFLRRTLMQAMPIAIGRGPDGDEVLFQGKATHMRYAAVMPGYMEGRGIELQQLEIIEDGHGLQRLVESFALLPPDGSAPHPYGQVEVLLDGIRYGGFRFLGTDRASNVREWSSQWTDARHLPLAVAIDLELVDGVRWPQLQIPIRAAIDPYPSHPVRAQGDIP